MLADPRRSRVVLLNLTRGGAVGAMGCLDIRCGGSLALLPICHEIIGAKSIAAGEYLKDLLPVEVAASIQSLESEALSPWRDPRFAAYLADAEVSIIFLGGAFLEEEVLTAALEGAKRGYEMRLLSDFAFARREGERQLAVNRLAHHGIVTTTIRQALFEWVMDLDDRAMTLRIQQLLS